MNARHSYPMQLASRARFDGSSLHEVRPGQPPAPGLAPVGSVSYEADGSTRLVWRPDGYTITATGYGRHTRQVAA